MEIAEKHDENFESELSGDNRFAVGGDKQWPNDFVVVVVSGLNVATQHNSLCVILVSSALHFLQNPKV